MYKLFYKNLYSFISFFSYSLYYRFKDALKTKHDYKDLLLRTLDNDLFILFSTFNDFLTACINSITLPVRYCGSCQAFFF